MRKYHRWNFRSRERKWRCRNFTSDSDKRRVICRAFSRRITTCCLKRNTNVLFGLSSRTTGVTLSFQSSMTHTDIMFSKVEKVINTRVIFADYFNSTKSHNQWKRKFSDRTLNVNCDLQGNWNRVSWWRMSSSAGRFRDTYLSIAILIINDTGIRWDDDAIEYRDTC